MDILLSSGKAGRFYHVASILQQAGYLKRFITTSYFKQLRKNDFLSKCLVRISRGRVYNRYNERLDPEVIYTIFHPEILRRAIRFFPSISNGLATKLYNYLFDLASCRYITNSDIFYVSGTHGLFAAQKAKRLGSLSIFDWGSVHPIFYIKILKEEEKKIDTRMKLNYEYYLKRIEKEFEVADYIVVRSDFARKTFLDQGVPAKKLKSIISGADTEQFVPRPKRDDIFRIIFVGTLTVGKGIHYLLQAYKELRLPNSELLLIGRLNPSTQPILNQYAGYYTHISIVPHRFLKDYYCNSSVFVFPSLVEGSANVIYEAMACGLPVIATENSGSIVRDGKDGFIIPIRNIEALKTKLLYFYENESARAGMGRSAREYIQQYTWEKYGDNLINFFEDIIKEKTCDYSSEK